MEERERIEESKLIKDYYTLSDLLDEYAREIQNNVSALEKMEKELDEIKTREALGNLNGLYSRARIRKRNIELEAPRIKERTAKLKAEGRDIIEKCNKIKGELLALGYKDGYGLRPGKGGFVMGITWRKVKSTLEIKEDLEKLQESEDPLTRSLGALFAPMCSPILAQIIEYEKVKEKEEIENKIREAGGPENIVYGRNPRIPKEYYDRACPPVDPFQFPITFQTSTSEERKELEGFNWPQSFPLSSAIIHPVKCAIIPPCVEPEPIEDPIENPIEEPEKKESEREKREKAAYDDYRKAIEKATQELKEKLGFTE